MDRRALLGIVGGLIVFAISLSFIAYSHSDFDGQLTEQVNQGVPADKLMLQIDEDTLRMQLIAKKRLESYTMDIRYWGNGDLASPNDYLYYTQNYESEMSIISTYDEARKKFARREISKEQFLQEIQGPKEYFKLYK